MEAIIRLEIERTVDIDWDNIHDFDNLWNTVSIQIKELANIHDKYGYKYVCGSIRKKDLKEG